MNNADLVHEAVSQIFRRCPTLCGFTVREIRSDGTPEVVFDDVAIQPWAGYKPDNDLLAEIASVLLEVADEAPGAEALIAGHTFAPTLH